MVVKKANYLLACFDFLLIVNHSLKLGGLLTYLPPSIGYLFKNKNKTLINDLSAVSAYISKLNISEDLASELFNLAIKRREFRFLLIFLIFF
jgi:hypothetical protein